MRIDVLTLFPKMFDSVLGESMLKRAREMKKVRIELHNLRDWTSDAHRTADDKPFGGGPGMVMKIEPIYHALKDLGCLADAGDPAKRIPRCGERVVLMTPQGRRLDQKMVRSLARNKRLVIICGHYEGVDERVRGFVDEEISVGDYILTCGEIPALALIDAVARLVPGVLGDKASLRTESFEDNLLEYPQYTRPAVFLKMKTPAVLLSGNHAGIENWRKVEAIRRTKRRRPDLTMKRK